MRRGLLLLTLALALTTAATADNDKPARCRVYMFGFAASFTDSVAYITDIQTLDSAYVHKNGFLADRSLYSMQLGNYLLANMKRDNMTCMVFFDKKKSKLEKKYLKVRKKYRADHATVLSPLGNDMFRFTAEEWIEPMEEWVEPMEMETGLPEKEETKNTESEP